MSKESIKMLKKIQSQKSNAMSFVIYPDTESLLEKMYTCENNPQNLFAIRESKNTACGYSIFTQYAADSKKK